MRHEKVLAELCSALAVLALLIACVWLYGTISYTAARRTGEIGIRMAPGAARPDRVDGAATSDRDGGGRTCHQRADCAGHFEVCRIVIIWDETQ